MQFSKEERKLWVEDWLQSGKSAWAYAKSNGLNPQTFVRWTKAEPEVKKLTEEPKRSFVEVSSPMLPPVHNASEILIEKGEVKIHIPLNIGHSELCAVMEGLGCA
jgi:transposase-like protein